jgi:putative ABC transport system ATP-binding protein
MMLEARGLTYRVGDRVILDGVDVAARGGRLLAVRGPSGAGKSTLLAVLGGLLRPETGTVSLDDMPVEVGDPALRRRVGIVFQGYGLVGALTGRENVAITLQARRVAPNEVRQRTTTALDEVGLGDVADHLTDEMSGGQQQRVAVARVLAAKPDVLLADEPTAELDSENREHVVALLIAQARAGAIVVIASHDPDVVARCDEVLELESGHVVAAR